MDSMLDRRTLLKLGAAGAAALAAPTGSAVAQDKPKRGGTLTIGRNHDADTLYPGRSTGLSAIATNLLLYDGLVLHDFQMKIRPALAERWETSADGLTWTFYLRKNVKFHCGAPLTAQDVKDHFDRWIDPKEAFPTRAKVASLAETRVVDEHTVVCKLKNPTLVFLNNVSQTEWSYASIPHAKHVAQYGQDYGVVPASVCGTGPFRLKDWSKDDRMELVRHDGYAWGSPAYDNTAAPWVDRIVFRTLPEDAARAAELEAGGIDLDIDVSPQHIARLEGRGVKVTSIPRLSSNHIGFNVEKEVFKDVRVRKAVAHAVNRQEIVQFVMKGQADVSHGFLHPLVAGREHEGADAALHGGLRARQVEAAPDRGGMDAGRGRHARRRTARRCRPPSTCPPSCTSASSRRCRRSFARWASTCSSSGSRRRPSPRPRGRGSTTRASCR